MKLATVPQNVVPKLQQALSASAAALKDSDLTKRLAKTVPELPEAEASTIIEALLSLYMLVGRTGRSNSEIANDVVDSLQASSDGSTPMIAEREPLKERLEALLSI